MVKEMKNTQEHYQEMLNNVASNFEIVFNKYTHGYMVMNEEHKVPAICGYNYVNEIDLHNYLKTLQVIKQEYPNIEFTENLLTGINHLIGMSESIIAYKTQDLNELLQNKTLQEYQTSFNMPIGVWIKVISLTLQTIKEIVTNTDSSSWTYGYNGLIKVEL